MKTRTAALAVGIAAWLAVGPAFAQATEVGRQNLHRGTITDIDYSAKTLTLETRTGPEQFTLQPGAVVAGADNRKSFDALAVGETVTVRAIQDENQRWLVGAIQVVDPHELEGQLEDRPAFDEADTATVARVDVEAGSLEVETREGPQRYRVTAETRILEGGEAVALGTLEPGERVVVSSEESEPGQFTARTVTVVSGGPAPADRPAPRQDAEG